MHFFLNYYLGNKIVDIWEEFGNVGVRVARKILIEGVQI